jgi:hypothetical protein
VGEGGKEEGGRGIEGGREGGEGGGGSGRSGGRRRRLRKPSPGSK